MEKTKARRKRSRWGKFVGRKYPAKWRSIKPVYNYPVSAED